MTNLCVILGHFLEAARAREVVELSGAEVDSIQELVSVQRELVECREEAAGMTITETPEISEVAVDRISIETDQSVEAEGSEVDVSIAASPEVQKDRQSDMDRATDVTTIEEIRTEKDAGPKKTASESQT